MSQHIAEYGTKKYVFGWDQPLQSFYFQVHDLTKDQDDESRISVWFGSSPDSVLYEVEDLTKVARRHGLHIDHAMCVKLYGEKDDGL